MHEIGKKIRSGTSWLFVGKLTGEVGQFLAGIVLARLLVPADFGLVTTVGILTGIAGFVSGAGTGQALVRAEHVELRHFHVVFTLQLLLSCAIYLFFVVVAPWFANFFGDPIYRDLLLLSGLSFFLRPFITVPSSWLQRDMRFRPLVLSNALLIIVSSAVSITLAYLGYGPWSLVIGGLVGSAINAVVLRLITRLPIRMSYDSTIVRELGAYGAKVAMNNLIEHFRGQTLILFLSKFHGPGDVGLFNRAIGLSQIPMSIIGSAPYQAVFRALSAVQGNQDQSRYIYYRTITLVAVYTMPFYVGLWWLAKPLIMALYGPNWVSAAEPLTILAGSGFLACFGNSSGAVIEARNRVGIEVILGVAALVWLVLLSALVFWQKGDLVALAWVLLSTLAIIYIGAAVIAAHELGGSFIELLRALTPALLLNSLLILVFWSTKLVLLAPYEAGMPMFYVLTTTAIGGFSYGLAFLFLPIPQISTEANRWKSHLRPKLRKQVGS